MTFYDFRVPGLPMTVVQSDGQDIVPVETDELRIFVNRRGRAWVTPDFRPPVPAADRDRLIAALDAELRRRLPAPGR